MKRTICTAIRRASHSSQQSVKLQSIIQHGFHSSKPLLAIKPFILADIGEGIREVQIIQWFVEPGARVEQMDKICEVASDKAIVEITSRYDGLVTKLYYDKDSPAQVGKPLCDIDVNGDPDEIDQTLEIPKTAKSSNTHGEAESIPGSVDSKSSSTRPPRLDSSATEVCRNLATPAVRGLLKEHNLDLSQIQGTGRDGRVLKEDIHNHLALGTQNNGSTSVVDSVQLAPRAFQGPTIQEETIVPMSPIQSAMFRSMTKSLAIPQFLYSDEVDLTNLSALRSKLNSTIPISSLTQESQQKISYLPFIIKAVSQSILRYPMLNATVAPQDSVSTAPKLLYRSNHNIGIAMDTPLGLMVPVIKNVQDLSIIKIAEHMAHIRGLAAAGKLTAHPDLLSRGTITISNIGNIGGGILSPVLLEGTSAILGIGKARELPRFKGGDGNEIERRLISTFSWSADHRVLDGATIARFAENVSSLLGEPGKMIVEMR